MSYSLETIRHSLAHVMAAAVQKLYPDVKFAGGPAIENGFYYDFDTGHRFSEEDFAAIEKEMRGLIKSDGRFERREISAREAREIFEGQPYKLEWISEKNAESPSVRAPSPALSIYKFRDFTDLCRGPHVESAKDLPRDGFKIRSVAGAYWKGDSKNKMLQRIYVDAFETKDQLDAHVSMMAEAERRDHKKLGPALDLFFLDPRSPGNPYWLPNGLIVYKELLRFWSIDHENRGYHEFRKPLMNKKELYETSGHWDHYREDMFVIEEDKNNTFAISPMSCPNAIVAYQRDQHSYNDLPHRLSDSDMLYRHEASGGLNGLFRTMEFNQDDAHIFLSEDQVEDEYNRILDMVRDYYDLFGIKARIDLSTRPDSFIGEVEAWDRAEAMLKKILIARYGKDGFGVKEKDGAFYGPKLDIGISDSLGREWQCGTIQLDFQLPGRFGCCYTDKNGEKKTPILIHRTIYGSLGRFFGLLLEHVAGKLPVWLSPVHAVVIPIGDQFVEYADKICAELNRVEIATATRGLRVRLDAGAESMQKRIRNAQMKQIPYMIIVGQKEAADGTISIRTRDGAQQNNIALSDFIADLKTKIKTRTMNV